MLQNRKRRKRLQKNIVIILALLCMIFMGRSYVQAQDTAKTTTIFTFFYNNSCASCHEDEDIYAMFNRCFSSQEKQQMNYEVRVYNAFLESGEEMLEKYCSTYGQNRQGQEYPILAVGDIWISGYEEIETYLKGDFKESDLFKTGSAKSDPDKTGSENTAETDENKTGSENTAKTDENNKNENNADSIDVSSEQDAIFTEFLEIENEKYEDVTEPYLLLFTTYNCEDCKKVKEELAELKEEDPDEFSGVQIAEYNIGEGTTVEVLRKLYACYGVEEKRQQVPVMFVGNQVLIGKEEITKEGILKTLEKPSDFKTFSQYVQENDAKTGVSEVNYLTLALSGLLAGFNPCGISMLLMLLSILMTSKANILKNGLLYVLAKTITYIGIGIGAYVVVSATFSAGLEKVSSIVTVIMALLLLLLSCLNFIDFLNARKQEYGKIRMQLPVKLRRFNHNMIKHLGGVSDRALPFVAMGLGIAISFGEFFCTGQIYMASILYMLRSQAESVVSVILMFAVYVGMMMIPTLAVVLIIQKTHQAQRVSEFMLRRMDLIKLLNAILFFGFFLYLIL